MPARSRAPTLAPARGCPPPRTRLRAPAHPHPHPRTPLAPTHPLPPLRTRVPRHPQQPRCRFPLQISGCATESGISVENTLNVRGAREKIRNRESDRAPHPRTHTTTTCAPTPPPPRHPHHRASARSRDADFRFKSQVVQQKVASRGWIRGKTRGVQGGHEGERSTKARGGGHGPARARRRGGHGPARARNREGHGPAGERDRGGTGPRRHGGERGTDPGKARSHAEEGPGIPCLLPRHSPAESRPSPLPVTCSTASPVSPESTARLRMCRYRPEARTVSPAGMCRTRQHRRSPCDRGSRPGSRARIRQSRPRRSARE